MPRLYKSILGKVCSLVAIFTLMSMTLLLTSTAQASASEMATYTLLPTTINNLVIAGILFDSGSDTLYESTSSGAISVINTSNNTIESTIQTSSGLYQMVLDQATNTIYAATFSNSIIPINLATGKEGTPIQAPTGTSKMVLDQATNTIYAAT